jgi:hypothetical protein
MPDSSAKTPPTAQQATTQPTANNSNPAFAVVENSQNDNTIMVASSIGALAGLGYAFSRKKGFWGYAGFFLLGSIAGSLVGNIITSNKTKKPK